MIAHKSTRHHLFTYTVTTLAIRGLDSSLIDMVSSVVSLVRFHITARKLSTRQKARAIHSFSKPQQDTSANTPTALTIRL